MPPSQQFLPTLPLHFLPTPFSIWQGARGDVDTSCRRQSSGTSSHHPFSFDRNRTAGFDEVCRSRTDPNRQPRASLLCLLVLKLTCGLDPACGQAMIKRRGERKDQDECDSYIRRFDETINIV